MARPGEEKSNCGHGYGGLGSACLTLAANLANLAKMKVNMHEAKSTLSKLVDAVERGEEVVIARSGSPVVRLVPVRQQRHRALGGWKGRVHMADDFNAPLPDDELKAWEG